MDEQIGRQIRSEIESLEATNRGLRSDIANPRAILAHEESGSSRAQGHENYIRGLESTIRANEQKISQLKRSI